MLGTKWCKCCEADKPEGEFLRLPKFKSSWRVRFCNECAAENMRKWGLTSLLQHRRTLKNLAAKSAGGIEGYGR